MKKAILTISKVIIFFIVWAVLSTVIDIPVENPVIWRFIAELIPLVVIIILTLIFIKIEKQKLRIPINNNPLRGLLIGIFVGVLWLGFSAGLLILTNYLKITEINNVPMLWIWIISAFINVIMQELLVRGYIYQLIKEEYNLPAAIAATTIIFTLLHGGAFEAGIIPVLNVITMCLFTTFLYEAEGTILAPTMSHALWNIIGGLILGGVRLADDYPSFITMTPSKNQILSGGDCMIEGSVVVLIVNIILILIFYKRYKNNTKKA